MKKRIVIASIILTVFALVLFMPIPTGLYDDGGTCEYSALTYKIVKWNKMVTTVDENGVTVGADTYKNVTVYWLPDNYKSIDELWKMERQGNE